MKPHVLDGTPWQFPRPEVFTLANGLTVWQFDLPHQHIATFELVLPASLTAEKEQLQGVANLALHAIDEGTRAHPDGRITELLDAHGAALHGTTRHRYTTFGGQASARRLADVLPLFVEVLTQPAYTDRDVAHHVEAAVANHASKLASPGAANRMALRRAMYGAHRDGAPTSGTPHTLASITPSHVHEWHSTAYAPRGATLLIAGVINDEALGAMTNWTTPGRDLSDRVAAPAQPSRVVVVDQRDAVQATVGIATRSVGRTDIRWPALRVAGHVMAGAFASRLNLELRERLGYTYGINGGFAADVVAGQFHVGGSVRTDVVGDAVARLLNGLSLRDPFTEAEVREAQQYLIRYAPLANETSADIVAQASALAAAGLTTDYLAQHFADLARVTADDATAAFRETITPERLTIAVTGDAGEIVPALTALGLEAEVVSLD